MREVSSPAIAAYPRYYIQPFHAYPKVSLALVVPQIVFQRLLMSLRICVSAGQCSVISCSALICIRGAGRTIGVPGPFP
jgi:hypothetical protein